MRCFAGLALITISICPLVAQNTDTSSLAAPGQLVRVGNRRLHINCSGQGEPTVILIHGAGAYSFDWSLVQPEVAKLTRVCSYDRAGHAWSDLAPSAQSYSEMAEDLHQLLQNTPAKVPVVLVGHSGGGGVVRVFAARHRDEVAGAVLVETGHPDSLNIINGKLVRVTADTLPREGASVDGPRSVPPNPTAEITPPYDKLPGYAQTFRLWSEREGRAPASRAIAEVKSIDELRQAHGEGHALFGQKPLVVIYRAKGGYRPIGGILTADQAAEMERQRLVHVGELQKLSDNSMGMIAEKSGHDVHLAQPELVVEAVRRVVESVREKRPLGASR